MRRWMLVAALLLSGAAQAMPVADYVAALERADALLGSKQLAAAQAEVRPLLDQKVTWSGGTFVADASLVQAILQARTAEGPHRARLASTIAELRRATGMDSARADRKLLEQIAADQRVPELPKGGRVDTTIDRDIPLLERIALSIAEMIEWVIEKLGQLLDWLLDLLPRNRGGAGDGGPLVRWIVFAVVGLILLIVIVLAVRVIRRSRAAGPEEAESAAPLASRADEDPLSRGATEWERYAGYLAAAGRYREAIRAWYHAVLVTCYAYGILHFRKGRTNWEYVALLAPSLEWRPHMIELTRRFEREWYGSLQSTADALEECSQRAQQILGALRGAA